jgi:enolase-phosphatase E1
MTIVLSAQNIRGLLLDIEGTTTPIAFVYDVLFPFARAHVKDYLSHHFASEEVRLDVERLRAEHAKDIAGQLSPPAIVESSPDAGIESIVNYVHWLMDRDRKSTGLKSLQGKIWEEGYRSGALKSEVFPDVPLALKRWHHAGLKIAIFSSGSVLAQKLLFAYTAEGSLTQLIDAYFDTTTGPKTTAESYLQISSELQINPEHILFISDVTPELEAATGARMQSALCIRPGNAPQPKINDHRVIRSFDELRD